MPEQNDLGDDLYSSDDNFDAEFDRLGIRPAGSVAEADLLPSITDTSTLMVVCCVDFDVGAELPDSLIDITGGYLKMPQKETCLFHECNQIMLYREATKWVFYDTNTMQRLLTHDTVNSLCMAELSGLWLDGGIERAWHVKFTDQMPWEIWTQIYVPNALSNAANYLILVPLGVHLLALDYSASMGGAAYCLLKAARFIPTLAVLEYSRHAHQLQLMLLLLGMGLVAPSIFFPDSLGCILSACLGVGSTYSLPFSGDHLPWFSAGRPAVASKVEFNAELAAYVGITIGFGISGVLYSEFSWPAIAVLLSGLLLMQLVGLLTSIHTSSWKCVGEDESTIGFKEVWNHMMQGESASLLCGSILLVAASQGGVGAWFQSGIGIYWTSHMGQPLMLVSLLEMLGYGVGVLAVVLSKIANDSPSVCSKSVKLISGLAVCAVLLVSLILKDRIVSITSHVTIGAILVILDVLGPASCALIAPQHMLSKIAAVRVILSTITSVICSFFGAFLMVIDSDISLAANAFIATLGLGVYGVFVWKQARYNAMIKPMAHPAFCRKCSVFTNTAMLNKQGLSLMARAPTGWRVQGVNVDLVARALTAWFLAMMTEHRNGCMGMDAQMPQPLDTTTTIRPQYASPHFQQCSG